jgi:zinc protease
VKRLGAALLLVASVATAQQVTPPPPAAPRLPNLPKPVEKTLANGLRVIVIPKHDVPLVSARVMIRSGSEEDPAGLAGLAQLTASLLTQGTATRTAEQIARGVENLGASLQAQAGWDSSSVEVTVMSPNFEKAMGFVSDVAINPAFRNDDIERLRQQAIDLLQVSLTDPGSLARFVAARVVFGDLPYGHATEGTPESLAAINREQIAAFHKRHFRPENATLVVAGDIKPEAAFAIAQKAFAPWKQMSGARVILQAAGSKEPPKPRVLVVDMPDAGQAAVVVARRGLKRVDPLYYSAIVTNSVLGGGYSARLNQEIRIKRGLSYGASSMFDLRREEGPFVASTQTKNESAAEVAGIIVDEMKRLSSGDVPEAELTPRKAVLIGNFARSLETSAGIVGRISALALYGLSLEEINRYISGVQGISSAVVREFATSRLAGDGTSIVIVGDAKKFLDPLKQRFGSVEVIPIDQLDLNVAALTTTRS